MIVTIGNLNFDHSTYDAVGDVLYLHRGNRQAAADSEETPEGHVVRFDADGRIIGITIISPRHFLDHDGKVEITLPPQHVEVPTGALDQALVAA